MSQFSSTTTLRSNSVVSDATKVSLIAMAPPSFPNPELSLGSRCQSLDPLGRYKCWNVRGKSPADMVWRSVSQLIRSLLEEKYEHLDARGSELLIEIYMIGKRPASASPTVVFSCENKCARQKAIELVDKQSILRNHPGVRMAQSSRLPRLLALDEDIESAHLLEGVYLNGPVNCSGLSVLVVSGDYTAPRRATIGGFICINNKYYGLTVAHAFQKRNTSPTTSMNVEMEFSFFDHDEDSGSLDEEDHEMTSKGT